jgi:histidyl-tRNA synthetase
LKPSIPKGTRDFSPAEMQRRNYIFETIKNVFLLHGFQQIETPAMENLSVLEGKYGEEGDKLLFRILNSGPVLENLKPQTSDLKLSDITEKGLRYDLTVPFARYVVQHRNEINFPFKRFQMQPVWRADRPQRGRYREFYQCDADIIGSNSLLNEVELIQIIDEVFTQFKIPVTIKINNRKILQGIAELIGEPNRMLDLAMAYDKLEKIGSDGVILELKQKGFSEESIKKLSPFITTESGSVIERMNASKMSQILEHGYEELTKVMDALVKLNKSYNVEYDFSLARGLNYYTGAIIEVKANGVQIGSIAGGGRYDDLTGIFGLPNVSGVGISFGVDRIYDVMEELKLFDALKTEQTSTQILFVNFGEREELFCLKLVTELRHAGIAAELYPDHDKIKKQMSYANDRKIPFVALIGEEEMKSGKIKLKDMQTGEEKHVSSEQIQELIVKR